jgi:phosphomannomutase
MTLKESLEYDPVELLFGTSGLRGLVHDMTDLECYINTAGFIRFLEKNKQLKLNSTVSIAGDLRHSTPEILRAVATAIKDYGYQVNYCGYIPTPALALWGLNNGQAVIMITGSHIPEDRNGIKFYKPDGEVLKEDESAIKESVSITRNEFYSTPAQQSWFDTKGRLTKAIQVGEINRKAELGYLKRFQSIFSPRLLTGKHIVVYQHSAVGRDLLVKILEYFGAKVTAVLRSEKFIPVDSENITPEFQNIFRKLSQEYPDRFAIVSTDGDSDRPIVVDEKGVFHRGDILGAIVAQTLSADFAAYPISSSDAVDKHLASKGIIYEHTKIGSPYVIKAMQRAGNNGHTAIVGWEVNGGFLTGSNLTKNGLTLSPLPTLFCQF